MFVSSVDLGPAATAGVPDAGERRPAARPAGVHRKPGPATRPSRIRCFRCSAACPKDDSDSWQHTMQFLRNVAPRSDRARGQAPQHGQAPRPNDDQRRSSLRQVLARPHAQPARTGSDRSPRPGRDVARRPRRAPGNCSTCLMQAAGESRSSRRFVRDVTQKCPNAADRPRLPGLHRILVRPAGRPGPGPQGAPGLFAVLPRHQSDRDQRPARHSPGDHRAVHPRRMHAGDLGDDVAGRAGVHPAKSAGAVRPGHDDEPVPVLPDVRPVRGDLVGGLAGSPLSGRASDALQGRPPSRRSRLSPQADWCRPTS